MVHPHRLWAGRSVWLFKCAFPTRLIERVFMKHADRSFCRRTRREFLWEAGAGFTGVALTGLLSQDGFFGNKAYANETPRDNFNPLAAREPHFAGRCKSVIFLFMYGGPSQVDTFD